MSKVIRAYIATHRPTKFDGVPRDVYKPISDRFAFGIKICIGAMNGAGSSWVKSKEPMLAQITAVSHILSVLEELEEEFDLQLLLRTAHLLRRIGMIEDRLLKLQMGHPVRPIKNEEIWVDTTRRLHRVKYGIRPALPEDEISELASIEGTLKDGFYLNETLTSPTPPEPGLSLRDG